MDKKLMVSILALSISALAHAQRITLTAPAAESVWNINRTYTITWTTRGDMIDRVKIFLLAGGSRALVITSTTPNSGSYSWTVPDSQPPGRYSIRVRTVDNAVTGDSGAFSIAVALPAVTFPNRLTVRPPAAGAAVQVFLEPQKANYDPGESLTVRLHVRPDVTNPQHCMIYMRKPSEGRDRTGLWLEMYDYASARASLSGSDVRVPVSIPSRAQRGSEYLVTANLESDYFDSTTFRIAIGTNELTILSPAAGDTWRGGGAASVSWTAAIEVPDPGLTLKKGGRAVRELAREETIWFSPASRTYVAHVQVPSDLVIGDDYQVEVSDPIRPGTRCESLPFRLAGSATMDLELTDMHLNSSGELILAVRAPEKFPWKIGVRITRLRQAAGRFELQEVREKQIRIPSSRCTINLGDAHLGARSCGYLYEVELDSSKRFDEISETNNTLRKLLFHPSGGGTIAIGRGSHTTLHAGDVIHVTPPEKPLFRVELHNCGTGRAVGRVDILQIGNWREVDAGHPLGHMVDHSVLLGSRAIDLASGEGDWVTMNEHDPVAEDSRIEVRFEGAITAWAPRNPVVVNVRREGGL
jgi:hypothetical protein